MISGVFAVIKDSGQREALNELYKKNEKRFYNIAFSKLGNENDAWDAVQEAFVRICDKPENLFRIPEDKRVKYINVIIRNVAFEMYGKRKKHSVAELTEDYIDDRLNVEEIVLGDISRNELRDFILTIPEARRDALMLKINFQLSNSEIAQALGITEETARKRISDAGIMIKKYLNEVRNNG